MLDLYKTLKPRDIIIKEKLEETWVKLESDYLTNPLETIKHLVLTDSQIIDDDEDFTSYFEEIKANKLNDTIVNHVVFNLKKGIGYIPLNFQFHYDHLNEILVESFYTELTEEELNLIKRFIKRFLTDKLNFDSKSYLIDFEMWREYDEEDKRTDTMKIIINIPYWMGYWRRHS